MKPIESRSGCVDYAARYDSSVGKGKGFRNGREISVSILPVDSTVPSIRETDGSEVLQKERLGSIYSEDNQADIYGVVDAYGPVRREVRHYGKADRQELRNEVGSRLIRYGVSMSGSRLDLGCLKEENGRRDCGGRVERIGRKNEDGNRKIRTPFSVSPVEDSLQESDWSLDHAANVSLALPRATAIQRVILRDGLKVPLVHVRISRNQGNGRIDLATSKPRIGERDLSGESRALGRNYRIDTREGRCFSRIRRKGSEEEYRQQTEDDYDSYDDGSLSACVPVVPCVDARQRPSSHSLGRFSLTPATDFAQRPDFGRATDNFAEPAGMILFALLRAQPCERAFEKLEAIQ